MNYFVHTDFEEAFAPHADASIHPAICQIFRHALRAASFALGFCRYEPPEKSKEKPKVAYMAITSVDQKAMTITVESRNSNANTSKTYKFTARTKITVSGYDGTVSDLKPGLQIRAGAGADPQVADELAMTPPPGDSNS